MASLFTNWHNNELKNLLLWYFYVYLKGSFHLLLSGGWNVDQYFDNVIVFDTETESWSDAGVMKASRGKPGVSVVSLEDVMEYATDCVAKEIPSKYLQA